MVEHKLTYLHLSYGNALSVRNPGNPKCITARCFLWGRLSDSFRGGSPGAGNSSIPRSAVAPNRFLGAI